VVHQHDRSLEALEAVCGLHEDARQLAGEPLAYGVGLSDVRANHANIRWE